jgi:5-methylthioribose kinase
LWRDEELKRETAQLKYAFLTRAEALVHGDLHSGSIFVTEESTKMIDAEFAYYGPIGFDAGQFFANIALNYLSQNYHAKEEEKRADLQSYLLGVIRDTWHHFTSQFSELWHKKGAEIYTKVPGYLEHFLKQTFEDTVGFAGCETIRRTIGLAHVADLDSIEDFEVQVDLKKKALDLGTVLIKQRRRIKTIEQLIATIRSV